VAPSPIIGGGGGGGMGIEADIEGAGAGAGEEVIEAGTKDWGTTCCEANETVPEAPWCVVVEAVK